MNVPVCVFVIVRSGDDWFSGLIVVGSLAVVELEPPPEAVALFVTLDAAFAATSTVAVIVGYVPPTANASERVQFVAPHDHPAPLIPVMVKPAGAESDTVTVPLVGAVPLLLTVKL